MKPCGRRSFSIYHSFRDLISLGYHPSYGTISQGETTIGDCYGVDNECFAYFVDAHQLQSRHRRLDYLLNRLFRGRSKKTSKLRVKGICEGTPPMTGGFPSQGPVTRKFFQFDDVIMHYVCAHNILWMYNSLWHADKICLTNISQIVLSEPMLVGGLAVRKGVTYATYSLCVCVCDVWYLKNTTNRLQ